MKTVKKALALGSGALLVAGCQFGGLNSTALQVVVVDKQGPIASDPAAREIIAKATALLKADHRVSTVVAPQPGISISKDGAYPASGASNASSSTDSTKPPSVRTSATFQS